MILIAVVLPAPLGPIKANTEPSGTSKLAPHSASTLPYRFHTSSTLITGLVMTPPCRVFASAPRPLRAVPPASVRSVLPPPPTAPVRDQAPARDRGATAVHAPRQ